MNSVRDELRRGSDSSAGRVGSTVGIRYGAGPARQRLGLCWVGAGERKREVDRWIRFRPKLETKMEKHFLFTNLFIFSNSFDSNSNLNGFKKIKFKCRTTTKRKIKSKGTQYHKIKYAAA
jgi:hypothetical protein